MENRKRLSVRKLKKHFRVSRHQYVHAVDSVSFDIHAGETLGLVGESGCGKTTVGRAILRLVEPDEGEVLFNGVDIRGLGSRKMIEMRREMQIVFQDPFSSLDPRKTIEALICQPLSIHRYGTRNEKRLKVSRLLEKVGLSADMRGKYPHELDGGRCQRVGIARALAVEPSFLVCDEPVSSLDVSVQAQILNLLSQLRRDEELTLLFISHDLSVIRRMSDRIVVMYLGTIVEIGSTDQIFVNPLHPYTKALLSAVTTANLDKRRTRIILRGDVPTAINVPPGCRFCSRCNEAMPICSTQDPISVRHARDHVVTCHLYSKSA